MEKQVLSDGGFVAKIECDRNSPDPRDANIFCFWTVVIQPDIWHSYDEVDFLSSPLDPIEDWHEVQAMLEASGQFLALEPVYGLRTGDRLEISAVPFTEGQQIGVAALSSEGAERRSKLKRSLSDKEALEREMQELEAYYNKELLRVTIYYEDGEQIAQQTGFYSADSAREWALEQMEALA